ncbi:hypothetical protein BDL97_04G061200 [Sphagnum fallax]|nr:hypothetical protein BDL97_04G061200 [Sphagnum fallax]
MEKTNEKSLVEVSGVVSPLALQLQEAWLQTQMPKAQKQSLIPLTTTITNTPEEISVRDSISPLPKDSMLKSLATIFPEVDATTKQDQPTTPFTQKDGDVSTQPKAIANRNRVHPMNSLINGVNHVQSIKPSSIMQGSKLPLVKVPPSLTSQPPPHVQSSNVSTLPTSLQKLEPIGVSNVDSFNVVEIVEENQPLFSYLNGLMDENLEEVIDNDPQMMARELGVLTDVTTVTHEEIGSFPKWTNAWANDRQNPLQEDDISTSNHFIHGDDPEVGGIMTTNDNIEFHDMPKLKYANIPNSHRIEQISNEAHMSANELNATLLRCAKAVEQKDFKLGAELIGELRKHTTPYGNGPQRVAYYFMESLVAKMSSTGRELYMAITNNRPSAAEMLNAMRSYIDNAPFMQVVHCFANNTLLEAFKGASRVHVVDYGIMYGIQWPSFMHMLAQRPGGPPQLRITGIDRPQPGFKPLERIQETGHRLARLAKEVGVPFEFHAIADKWETITPAHLFLRKDEILGVNCALRFRHMMDESIIATSPRTMLLNKIRSMNPKVFVQVVISAGYNLPLFIPRFQEALHHNSVSFDVLEKAMYAEPTERIIFEKEILGRIIFNVVACDGLERVERPGTYREWDTRARQAGFTHLPRNPTIIAKLRAIFNTFQEDFGIGEDDGWCLAGWKGHILYGFTAWEPAIVNPPSLK